MWSSENWRVAHELGTYMDIISWSVDEVWEVTLQTRWETRTMDTVTEPYTGRPLGKPQPLLPVWDYELPPVTGLKAPATRTRLEGLDEGVLHDVGCIVGRAQHAQERVVQPVLVLLDQTAERGRIAGQSGRNE